jgi:glutathione synthase/RimK-type ligase-like ATP-grasp enzyme
MNVKNYIFAGLDFLIDEKGDAVFLEANFSPGGLKKFEELYGKCEPLIQLCNFIKKKFAKGSICLLYSKDKIDYNFEDLLWKLNTIKNIITNFDVHLCSLEDQDMKKFAGIFKDRDGIMFKPDVVMPLGGYKNSLIEKYCFVINTLSVRNITSDKLLSYEIMKNSNIRTPKTFLIKNPNMLFPLIKRKEFKDGFVLKPRRGEKGKGVKVFNSNTVSNKVIKDLSKGEYLLQEKIKIKKIGRNYWDLRVFVVNGKFIGGIKRVSLKPVVNLSQGGRAEKIENQLLKKVKNVAIECVNAIDSASQKT